MAAAVAGDQLGVVEVVAGVHAHALRQAGAQPDLLVPVEQRELDAVDLGGVGRDDVDADVHRREVVGGAEIARERRVEHLAEPMDDAGLAQLREDAVVDLGVVVGRARARRRAPGSPSG